MLWLWQWQEDFLVLLKPVDDLLVLFVLFFELLFFSLNKKSYHLTIVCLCIYRWDICVNMYTRIHKPDILCIYKVTKLFLFPDDFRGKKQPTSQYYKVSCSYVTFDVIILLHSGLMMAWCVHVCQVIHLLFALFFFYPAVIIPAGQHSSDPTC